MPETFQIAIPNLDLPGTELRLSIWHQADGRYVREGDRLLEIVAGDVVVDLSSPAEGHLSRVSREEDVISVGQAVGVIQSNMKTPDDQTKQPLCLDQFLKLSSVAETGGRAKWLIQNGEVRVNGEVETRRRRKLVRGDVVEFNGQSLSPDSYL